MINEKSTPSPSPASAPSPAGGVREAAIELLSHLKLYDFIERDPSGELHDRMYDLTRALSSPAAGEMVLRAALQLAKDMLMANGLDLPHTMEVIDAALSNAPGQEVVPVADRPTGHVEIAHDGFAGTIQGHYVTREGKRGVVVQQDGTRVVHVYGEKWLAGAKA